MKQNRLKQFLLLGLAAVSMACTRTVEIEKHESLANVNHPQVLYWFWAPNVLENDRYLNDMDSIAQNSPFDLIFLTARDGVNFYDYQTMRPIFARLVEKAHSLGLKIGLQLWDNDNRMPQEEMMRVLVEGSVTLDKAGKARYLAQAKHVRDQSINRDTKVLIQRSELFRAYAFEGVGNDRFRPGSLKEITNDCKVRKIGADKLEISIDQGCSLAGQRVYLLTEHYYNWNDLYGGYVSNEFAKAMQQYKDIPFDGMALDEYTHLRIYAPWLMPKDESWNERFYSPAMSRLYEQNYKRPMDRDLLYMRYAPEDDESQRLCAINNYMELMRQGPLRVETEFYKSAKATFGNDCFIGVHNTFHNSLTGDELWQTGANWWTVPREYGHSDEHTPLPTQMGIALCNPMNVLYNMFYHEKAETIFNKAAQDLAFGIRTHYHAINDTHGWGIKLESPEFLNGIAPIEEAARLLNYFNPSLPKLKTLIVFGMEALQNNYPETENSSIYKLNKRIDPERVAVELWQAGYRNALISSDAIEDGKVSVRDGKVILNGYTFDQLIYLYPNYAKPLTVSFLNRYTEAGGKLILHGTANYQFDGKPMGKALEKCYAKATVISSDQLQDLIPTMEKESILPPYASLNADGSYVQLFPKNLKEQSETTFEFTLDGKKYSGICRGMIALQPDSKGKIIRLAAKGLKQLQCNNKTILEMEQPTDLYFGKKSSNHYLLNLFGKEANVTINNL